MGPNVSPVAGLNHSRQESQSAAGDSVDLSSALMEVNDLSCRFGQRVLWQHLQFNLKPGERLAIAAESGRGKTVLLRALSGLSSTTSGTIRFEGQSLDHWSMPAYRSHVMLLAQQPFRDEGTVEGNLTRPFRLKSQQNRRYDRSQALQWLKPLGRDEQFLERSMDHLSGGEAQIVAILRALLLEPTVLLLDEPTSALDGRGQGEVEALLNRWLSNSSRHAWIWTTHDEEQRKRMCDSVLRLDEFA